MLQQGNLPDYVNKYGSLLYDKTAFLGDYFEHDGIVLFDELGRIQEVMDAWEREEDEWFLSLIEEGKMVHDVKPAFSLKEILAMLSQQKLHFHYFREHLQGLRLIKHLTFLASQCSSFMDKCPCFKMRLNAGYLANLQF